MKKLFSLPIVLSIFLISHALGQEASLLLPQSTLVPHYKLSISYNSTTVLIFPSAVKPVDRGSRDILAQKQPGVENVLKLKAAHKYFPESNLHVFTSDGRIYAFDIMYSDSLSTTHDLTGLPSLNSHTDTSPIISFTNEQVNSEQMANYVAKVKSFRHGKVASDRNFKMAFTLENIGIGGPFLFFKFKIENKSNLSYNLDFIRLYIRDKQKAKRTSVQEQEITPVFEESSQAISATSSTTHVLAVPQFTLSDGKQLIIECYEKNGGRYMTLFLKNKSLLKADKL